MAEKHCSACKQPICENGDFIKCAFGGCILHFYCSGVDKTMYKNMGRRRRNRFKCFICMRNSEGENYVSIELLITRFCTSDS